MSVPMTLSDLERRDVRSLIFFQPDLLNNARTARSRTTKFGRITHVGRCVFLGVIYAPTARGRGPSAPQLWGSFIFLHTSFDAELPNLTW